GEGWGVGLAETAGGARDDRHLAVDAEVHLLALEARLALGEECLDTFRGVLGLEGLEERADLDVDRLVDRRLEPVVDCLDDEPRRDRRALCDEAGPGPGPLWGCAPPPVLFWRPPEPALLGRGPRCPEC